jgi:hypothetical protein
MKRKKLRMILISCFLTTSLLFSGTAYAQDEELPDPGITPDSPFYFFDTLGKNIGLFFTFGPEAKARKALQYAEERLAEAQVMADKNRVREMTRAANDFDGFMTMVNERAEEARHQGASVNITETVALATSKHLSVLEKLKEQVPEQAREAIIHAKTKTLDGQKNALRVLAKVKPERAFEINSAAIESRLERARVKATENVTAEVEEALEDAAELMEIEEEISEIAQSQGTDNATIAQRIAHATSNRIEVLTGVYEKVPEPAKAAIARAMDNSVRKYDRAIEKLSQKVEAGEIPEEVQTLQTMREELKERLQLITSNQAQGSDNTSDNATLPVTAQAKIKEKIKEKTQNLKAATPATTESANKTREKKEVTASEKGQSKTP